MAREYKMVRRREKVEETRRRIAKATYELHSTVGPAFATVGLIADRAGLPRQTVYRNFGTQVDLFRSCIAFGLELNPLPDPDRWRSIKDPEQRLRVGLTELYAWFEASEPVMTNSVRDHGVVKEASEKAMEPVFEAFQNIHQTLAKGWKAARASALLSLAVDFSTWKKLHREQDMSSSAIVEMWSDLIRCLK
ncbi:MAG TPA: TetR/AcrR family transcriptional regulator [Candidatus Dormibacteraeota bacterium]|nr:TetR/AcrR family transcriptional regulator [Candidatus Dormibacteraeota bacterium]